MDGIHVVVFLVRCAMNLLLCDTVPTEQLRFAEMDSCRDQAAALVADRQTADPTHIWMAKCRYLLAPSDGRALAGAGPLGLPAQLAWDSLP